MDTEQSRHSFMELFKLIVGGDHDNFIKNIWRKNTHLMKSCLPELVDYYSSEKFHEDYQGVGYHNATLVIDLEDGKRKMNVPKGIDCVIAGVENNSSIVLQAHKLPSDLDMPEVWKKFRQFYEGACNYFMPKLPHKRIMKYAVSAIDFFQTNGETSIGGHYDTGDVFYFVLEGEKEWVVEKTPDFETARNLAEQRKIVQADNPPTKEYLTISVKAGDCLYVPPYTYHRVVSKGKSLAVSVGLPTYSSTSLIKYYFYRYFRGNKMLPPIDSYPLEYSGLKN